MILNSSSIVSIRAIGDTAPRKGVDRLFITADLVYRSFASRYVPEVRRGNLSTRTPAGIMFGRVAVVHVQGSPKDGGALRSRGVSNTRLGSASNVIWKAT